MKSLEFFAELHDISICAFGAGVRGRGHQTLARAKGSDLNKTNTVAEGVL